MKFRFNNLSELKNNEPNLLFFILSFVLSLQNVLYKKISNIC